MKQRKKEIMKKYRNDYMLLDRLRSDCAYFLGYGNRYEGRLWAGNVKEQIKKMRELYKKFPRKLKPQWLSLKDIRDFRKNMSKRGEYENKTISYQRIKPKNRKSAIRKRNKRMEFK